MQPSVAIVLACAALVAVTAAVGVRLCAERLAQARRLGISLQAFATSGHAAQDLRAVQAADNFRNLFEMPVLFYALCALTLALRVESPWLAAGAWVYVLLRALHSAIHCTSNRVVYRFTTFAASAAVLLSLWLGLVVELAAAGKLWSN
jgi:hypothetical protein